MFSGLKSGFFARFCAGIHRFAPEFTVFRTNSQLFRQNLPLFHPFSKVKLTPRALIFRLF